MVANDLEYQHDLPASVLAKLEKQTVAVVEPGASWLDFVRAATSVERGRRALAAWRRAKAILAFPSGKRRALATLVERHRDARVLIFTADNQSAYEISRKHLIMPLTCDIGPKERTDALRGLICTVGVPVGGAAPRIEISGPYDLFRRTLLYGRALAEIVPPLVATGRFSLQATCVVRGQAVDFLLASGDLVSGPPDWAPLRQPPRREIRPGLSQSRPRLGRDPRPRASSRRSGPHLSGLLAPPSPNARSSLLRGSRRLLDRRLPRKEAHGSTQGKRRELDRLCGRGARMLRGRPASRRSRGQVQAKDRSCSSTGRDGQRSATLEPPHPIAGTPAFMTNRERVNHGFEIEKGD